MKKLTLDITHPDLCQEWDFDKNAPLKPEDVTAGSGKKVWWKCEHGHHWDAVIYSRTNGCGCPCCSGRKAITGVNDLATLYPEIAEEWDYEANGDLAPQMVKCSSNKSVVWKCEHGHRWNAMINSRTRGNRCPYCSGREAITGVNDLATLYPEIAEEWDYEANGDLTPQMVKCSSHKDVSWQCKYGHHWNAAIYSRTKGGGCPYCSGRYAIVGENDLATCYLEIASEWDYEVNGDLKPHMVKSSSRNNVGWRCKNGHQWMARIDHRTNGSNCPYCSGYKEITGKNDLATCYPEIASEWDYSVNGNLTPQKVKYSSHKKVGWRCKKGHQWQTEIRHRTKGSKCPYCLGRYAIVGENDLATCYPEIASEWDYEANGDLTPQMVTCSSNKKVFWKCEFGHQWQARIKDRTRGNDCPYCAGQKAIAGVNDLATCNPSLASEWDYEANGNLTPQMVKCFSNKQVYWRCERGHSWIAQICNRSNGADCPYCSGREAIASVNDLATCYPEIATEWDDEANGGLTPHMVTRSSSKIVVWKCKSGHQWVASIGNRANGRDCPYCAGKKRVRVEKKSQSG